MDIFNPATEKLIKTVESDTPRTLQKKVELLQEGQKRWTNLSLAQRLQPMQKFLELLEKQEKELAQILTQEMGKPLAESLNEVRGAKVRVKFFIQESEKHLTSQVVQESSQGTTQMKEVLSFGPLGIINYISAWNYPYLVAMNVLIPALIGGNAVLYKPSEYTLLTGLQIERLLHEAGIPQDVLVSAIGGPEVGNACLDLPLQAYYFTGSYKTGQKIAAQVGPRMVPMGFELGGKDPLYVMEENRDLKSVAAAAVEGSFYNNGQSCCAVERIYVHHKVYDEFLEHFLYAVKETLRVGDPMEAGVTQGPLARAPQVAFLQGQLQDALEKGARIVAGGKPWKGKGFYFEPTVLVDVDHSMLVMKEESFGPIIGIQKVRDDQEALSLMQDTDYGLTAAIYSSNISGAEKLLQRLNVGTGYINCCDRVSPYLPWSGRNHSGLGATLSYLGILTFVRPKAYHIRTHLS